jgi:hypothetical protein
MFLEPLSADGATLKVQLETLRQFKRDVDKVIHTLEDSAAGPKHIGGERIGAGHLGKGFAEADALSATYTQVHNQLETFSGQLKDQIEAMQITVDCAQRGYTNVDVEQRERLWRIYRQTSQYDRQHQGHKNQPTGTTSTQAPTTPVQGTQNTGGVSS